MSAVQGVLSSAERSMRSVFVGNIPYEATEEQLKDIFAEVGPVVSFRLVYDRETGKPKGYGFCEYKDQEMALSAMRNLNGYELNGRSLRVDNAASEKSKEELKNLQASLGGPPVESPYGPEVTPESAPDSISKVMCSMPPEQLHEFMIQMKQCVESNPNETRTLLLQNPQLAYALLQAQVIMKIHDVPTAASLLHPAGTQQAAQNQVLLPTPEVQIIAPNVGSGMPIVTDVPTVFPPVSLPAAAPIMPPNPLVRPAQTQSIHSALHGERPPLGMRTPSTVMPSQFPERDHMPMSDRDLRQSPMVDRDMRNPMLIGDKDMRQQPMSDQDLRGPPMSDGRNFDPRYRNQSMQPPMRPMHEGGMGPNMRGMPPDMMNRGPMFDRNPMNPPMQMRAPLQGPRMGDNPLMGGVSPGNMSSTRPSNSLAATAAAIAPHDQEKAQLIMQVLQLTDQQIALLPADQRQSIMILKEQIARAQQAQ